MATNETDLEPLIDIVVAHNGIVLNGHDHCLGHFYTNDTNFILSGGAGYPQAGDCNNGVATGPFAKFLAANNLAGMFIFVSVYSTYRKTMSVGKVMVVIVALGIELS